MPPLCHGMKMSATLPMSALCTTSLSDLDRRPALPLSGRNPPKNQWTVRTPTCMTAFRALRNWMTHDSARHPRDLMSLGFSTGNSMPLFGGAVARNGPDALLSTVESSSTLQKRGRFLSLYKFQFAAIVNTFLH
ncbi:hypothetical protein CEXT_517551 [Caerostris extrusa]|uniref:Uncharacterized protein n=1 Tax=Caerostris extrusa TaxID=172846 RepID=A0AAV4U6M1_CAEEX|nr:hypothetical protein CEXT_517551 [Caerostris extrusa]